jgi:outer membrane lipoprotein-sorting protein
VDQHSVDTDQVLDQVIEHLRNQDVPPYPKSSAESAGLPSRSRAGFSKGSRGMRRLIPLAAAVLALAFGSGIFFLGSPRWRGGGSAFAEVQKAIGSSSSVKFQVFRFVGDDDPTVTTVILQEPGRFRTELPGGEVIVEDFEGKERMKVSHRDRTALIEPLYPSIADAKDRADSLRKLRDLPGQRARKLGERVVAGRKLIDFSVLLDGEESKVTVDESTKLPIRMEVTHANRIQGKSVREVITDFVFDASLDDSLFRVVPPQGYTVSRRARREPNPQDAVTLVVSPETGIGAAKFGMSIDEVVRALGEPDWRKEQRFANNRNPQPELDAKDAAKAEYIMTELAYDARGFRLSTSDRGGLHGIECFNRNAMGPSVRDFPGRTREGIKLCASKADVIKAYGEPQAKMGSTNFMYPKLGWDFFFRGDQLISIRVSSPNPALEVEPQKDGSFRMRVKK